MEVILRLNQRGPHRICAARGTILRNSSLVDHKQRQPSITRHGELMGQSLALRPIPSKGFFAQRTSSVWDKNRKIGDGFQSKDLFLFFLENTMISNNF